MLSGLTSLLAAVILVVGLGGCGGGGSSDSDGASALASSALTEPPPTERYRVEPVKATSLYAATYDDGRAHLIRNFDGSIAHLQYTIASGWTAAGNGEISDASPSPRSQLHASFSGAGHALATWSESNVSGTVDVRVRAYLANGGWGNGPATLARINGTGATPRAAIGENGNAAVVWLAPNGVETHVNGAIYNPANATWSTPRRIGDDVGAASQLHLIPQLNGAFLALWFQQGVGICSVRSSRFDPGSGWGAPIDINKLDCSVASLYLAANRGGDGLAIWTTTVAGTMTLWASTYSPIAGWGAPTAVTGPSTSAAQVPTAAMNDTLVSVVAWVDGSDPRNPRILGRRLTGQTGWTAAFLGVQSTSSSAMEIHKVSLGLDGAGNATVAWQENRPGESEFGSAPLLISRFPSDRTPYRLGSGSGFDGLVSSSLAMSANGNRLIAFASGAPNPLLFGSGDPRTEVAQFR